MEVPSAPRTDLIAIQLHTRHLIALVSAAMRVVSLPAFIYFALYTACSTTASPVAGAIPSTFVLAPLHTPPPPPVPAGTVSTQSHIISDSYLVVLQDHLEEHEVDRHHAHVHALHQHDRKLRLMTSESADGEADHLEGIVHKYNIGKKANKAARKALKGYSGKFSPATLDAIRAMRDVKYVEKDSLVWTTDIERDAPWVSDGLSASCLNFWSADPALQRPKGTRQDLSPQASQLRHLLPLRIRRGRWARCRRLHHRHVSVQSQSVSTAWKLTRPSFRQWNQYRARRV